MKQFRVFIATPSYKWPPHPKHQMSVQAMMNHPGFHTEYKAVIGDALVERARAVLLAEFLEQQENGANWEFFLNIDNDIEFRANDIYNMCARDEPVIGSPYAFRSDKEGKKEQIVCRPMPGAKPKDFMVEVRYLGGGCTMLRADVIEHLMKAHPELRFKENPDMHDPPRYTYDLWNCLLVPRPDWQTDEDKEANYIPMEKLSEDYSLCHRINKLGYKTMMDLKTILSHWHEGVPYTLPVEAVEQKVENSNEI